ncbi:flagellin [Paenibacillus sp. MBLB4367]|uniref:flagellin N-terminal helical domain-containing protein n=1 Tax=Paenibacillus sp. MBLB4367 TaxID=3384767 RepID=UPI0039080708
MRINHNIAALNTHRQLTGNTNGASKSLEKLSSGLRINRAGDDAAGLAISEKMRAQIRGLDMAAKNSQDGISLIQTTEGALNETHSILQRMRELAAQSANDTNVNVDRSEIQKEINQLSSEINRIGNTTEFNTQKLLNGSGEEIKSTLSTINRGGAIGDTAQFAQVTGSISEQKGVNTIQVAAAITAGSTVLVGDQTFTAVSGPADASLGQFSIDTDVNATAASLAAAINANASLNSRFANAAVATDTITLTERAGQATGAALTASVVAGGTGTLTANETTASRKEVQGKYTFNLDKAFEVAGQTLTINSVALTAVASNAAAGQFNINADREQQVKDIAKAINADTNAGLGARFEATVKGTTITLTERVGKAAGAAANLTAAGATGIVDSTPAASAGIYNSEFKTLVGNGGKFTIDGVDIKVTNDVNDKGLADGTAMLAGNSLKQQADNLAGAINANAKLNGSYTASTTGDKLTLTQKAGKEALVAPVVTANTSAESKFEANFQIGANSGQSMTVVIEDMRANALAITGDKTGTVTAKNGQVASYAKTSTVTNGSNNENVEFALDVTDHKKASAALSVINDAIENVSSQRAQLGAVQNRLEHTINNLQTASENLTAAESRIRDVDMAKEMMDFTKNNILSQAAQAMLAQANQQPQGVLQLLR